MHHPTDRIAHTTAFVTPVGILNKGCNLTVIRIKVAVSESKVNYLVFLRIYL